MKEIKSKKYIYLEKKSQIQNLSGDSSFPPGVNQRMIDNGFGGEELRDVQGSGESILSVNWQEFGKWYLTGKSSLPLPFKKYVGKSNVTIEYKYSYREGESPKIFPIKASTTVKNKLIPIQNLEILSALCEYNPYYQIIEKDIQEAEEGKDFNSFEPDHTSDLL